VPERARGCVTLARVRDTHETRVAVVGHVEWVQFARVAHVPVAGEVVHAQEPFEEPAGAGGVASVQLARLAGAALLHTALGDDVRGHRSIERLRELGVQVAAQLRHAPTRDAVTLVDARGERTITTFGERLEPHGPPAAADRAFDAIYFTAGDVRALRWARAAARVLVASPRARNALGHGVSLDALVLSASDEIELAGLAPVRDEAELVVFTEGSRGGRYSSRSGGGGRFAAAEAPGPLEDSYGCGDSFVAGFTYALGAGMTLAEALALGARCGAWCATGRGPYRRQLTAADLASRA
jgi:ribokinase